MLCATASPPNATMTSAAIADPTGNCRRNSDVIEVLDGLTPGERVITSPYTGFTDKTRLDLSQ